MTNDERDPFEAELEALTPTAPSPDLHRRLGHALSPTNARPWSATILAITAAAASVALVTWLARLHEDRTVSKELATTTTTAISNPLADAQSATSLRDYRQALAESPARLDALLDAQSYRPMGPPDPAPPATSLARVNRDWMQ